MSRTLSIELDEREYAAVAELIAELGGTPEQSFLDWVNALRRQARQQNPGAVESGRFESLFGSIDQGRPTGTDNETIDADLAREYQRTGDA